MQAIKPYLLISIFCILAARLPAQVQHKLLLAHITTAQGLSSNDVKCIFEDSRGFIWIGTYDGLNRYDGRNIKTYRQNINDSNSLINSWVNSIEEDARGNLWVGTFGGVSRLNVAAGTFTNYYAAQLFPGQKCVAGEQRVFKDNNGTLWVSSGGLSYYNEATGRFVPQPFIPATPIHGRTKNQLVVSAVVDKKNNFWLGTMDGMYRYDTVSKQYARYTENPPDDDYRRNGDLLASITVLPDGNIMAAAWHDAAYVFTAANSFAKPGAVVPIKGKFDIRIFKVRWNGKTEYWAAHNLGIARLDEHLQPVTESDAGDSAISAEGIAPGITSIFQSRQGIIFIGSGTGVAILNPYLQVFKTYYFPGPGGKHADAGHIASIAFKGDTMLAASIYGNALYMFSNNWGLLNTINTFGKPGMNDAITTVYDIAKDNTDNNTWWLATFQGLVKFNSKTLAYKIYTPPPSDPLFFRHKRFYLVRMAGNNKIWLSNYKQDILCFDKATETFKVYQPFGTQITAWGMLVAKNGDVWLTAGSTLCKYNAQADNFTLQPYGQAKDVGFADIVEGKSGELWMASGNGIWRYCIGTKQWRNWSSADGLCNNYVDKILFDNNGRLWVTTNDGIAAFDTTQKIFYNFSMHEGLPANAWDGALAKNSKGIIYLGDDYGITFFDPQVAIRPSRNYPAYITNCQVNGVNYALPGSTGPKKISLGYNENNLNFQFTVVNLLQPFQTSYYYKLENFDKEWHLSPSGAINYTNLYAGSYVLRVSSNPSSGDTSNNDALYITIHNPFWKTWWFITSAIVLSLTSVTWGIRARINHIKSDANRRAAISQQMADLRMKALRSQMNPHFLFNSLNAIQECCLTGQVDAATQYLARFSKLVRYILENSSKQWISLQEEIEILKLYLDVESLRFTGSFNYSIENTTTLNNGLIKIPPMLVQPFAENAIWHGLMHKNGERHLWIRFYNDEEKLFVEVEDDGVGRSSSDDKTDGGETSHKSMGMGIVNERMKLIEETQSFPAAMEVIDKKDDSGKPGGTLIKLILPII